MWAAVTPFAKEYDAPWLYGVAALTNFSRVATRRHWFSDTVAGALLGYGIGSLLWEARRGKRDDSPAVYLTGNGVGVSVPLK
jgi:membrane-associated phospholipid phosphatase